MAQVRPTESKLFLKPQEPPQNFHKSIKPFTILANCIGLLPVYGNTSNSIEHLNFRWISLKTLFSFLLLLQAFCGSVSHVIFLFKNGMSSYTLLGFFGYFQWFLELAGYVYLATKWPELIKKWYEVDLAMHRVYDYPEGLNVRFRVSAAVAFFVAAVYIAFDLATDDKLVSNAISVISAIIGTQCINAQVLKCFIQMNFILSVLTWAVNDILVVHISTTLALRFKQVADRVLNYGINMQSLEFWSEIRTDYIRLFELCELINEYVCFQITLTFACNTLYLLLDLFFIIKYSNTAQSGELVFFYIDCFWCIFVVTFTTFYTAWVHDESKRFASALNNIPSENYNAAIELLMEQIPSNSVALSGNDLFRCTRGLIVNIVGAVITYELLLIQFSDAVISR